jgi:hypothetical protein
MWIYLGRQYIWRCTECQRPDARVSWDFFCSCLFLGWFWFDQLGYLAFNGLNAGQHSPNHVPQPPGRAVPVALKMPMVITAIGRLPKQYCRSFVHDLMLLKQETVQRFGCGPLGTTMATRKRQNRA